MSSDLAASRADLSGINQISGPLLLGVTFNWALFGVLTVQVYIYSLAFRSDTHIIKCIVYGVYLLEAMQSILIIYDGVQIFVIGFSNIASLYPVNTLWISLPIVTGLVTFICQGFFAYRISILARHRVLRIFLQLIMINGVVQLSACIVLGVMLKEIHNFERIITSGKTLAFQIVTSTWVIGSALGDALIAVCMISLLSYMDTDVPYTRNIVHRFVRLTAGTGSLSATIALVSLALMLTLPDKSYYKVSLAALGKMYSNSMMVLLNNRMRIEFDDGSTYLGSRSSAENNVLTEIEFSERRRGDLE